MSRRYPAEIEDQIVPLLKSGKSRQYVQKKLGISGEVIKTTMLRTFGHNRVTDIRSDLRMSGVSDAGTAEYAARSTLESIRWPDGPRCPQCGAGGKQVGGGMGARGYWKCLQCKWWFTVFSGTALHNTKSSRVGLLYVLRRVADTGKPPSFKELSRITGLSHVTIASTVARIRLCVASTVRGLGLESLRERYSWDELRSDIGKLAKEYSVDRTAPDARLHGLCRAIFKGAVVEREYAVKKGREEGKSFGRFKSVPITYRGKTMTTTEWARHIGVPYPTLLYRLNSGWPVGEALKHTHGQKRAKDIRLGERKTPVVKAMLASGRSMVAVARCFGVGSSTVKSVRDGRLYAHIDAAQLLPIVDWVPPRSVMSRDVPTGEKNPANKFTELDIVYLLCCRQRGVSQEKIAKRIGTNQATVSSILRGKTWNAVTGMPKIRKSRAKSAYTDQPERDAARGIS